MDSKNTTFYVVAGVLIVLVGVVGFLIGRSGKVGLMPAQDQAEKESFFTTQSATINGHILSVDGKNVKIRNIKKAEETFPLLNNALITKYTGKNNVASSSSDLKQIETNKDVVINLRLTSGEYRVVSILYPAQAPDVSPAPRP